MEESVKYEHNLSPNRPIYIIGDSFGGCLALSLASRNPEIDLVLILVNPGSNIICENSVAGNIASFGNGAKQPSCHSPSPSQIFDW
jgi:pimeloyl-ACP methyl ester carboxylesterase